MLATARHIGLLNPEKLKQLYTTMLHCRLVEEEACRLGKEGVAAVNCRVESRLEATEVGAIIGLQAEDCVAPEQRRDFVAAFILGTPLKQVFTQIFSQAANLNHPPNRANQPPQAPLIITGAPSMATRLNISTGVALAYKTQKKPGVVLAFCGDDATALASWREAVDFAVAHKLPIVHVVQDDLGSESANHSKSGANGSGADRGLPTLIVDANDVVAVYRVAQEGIRRAGQGHGPTLIACKTHRWPAYSGLFPVPHTPSAQGQSNGNAHDPIGVMEAYLAQKGLWSDAWKEKLVKTFSKKLQAAVQFAQQRSAKRAAGAA